VAHEMRAPLGSIIIFTDLLLKLRRRDAKEFKQVRCYCKQVKF